MKVLELEANVVDDDEVVMDEDAFEESSLHIQKVPENWQLLFQKERMQIAQLWDLCYVSIIHRSQFYLMFNGDPGGGASKASLVAGAF